MGGLGLKQISLFNSPLMSKLAWSFLYDSSSLWKEVLTKKYLNNISFLQASPKANDSGFWKRILKQRDFIQNNICFQINNGVSTRVWSDPWISTLPSHIPIPNPNYFPIDPTMLVSELILEEPRRWNVLLLNAIFSEHTSREKQKIPLANHRFHHIPDKIKWIHHSSGVFSVKSVYAAFVNATGPTESINQFTNWKNLWKLQIQDRLKLFL